MISRNGSPGLLIRNGEIVTDTERYQADIWCADETITRIGRHLEAPSGARIVEAAGRYVFPGFVDPHVHLHLCTNGIWAKDSYASGSKAALLGGTTFFMDFITPGRHEEPLAALAELSRVSAGQSACDFGWHLVMTRFDAAVESQVRELAQRGLRSLKVYLAYQDTLALDDAALYHTLRLARHLDLLTLVHCENAAMVAALQESLVSDGKTGPEWHYHSRPPQVETEGTTRLLAFAAMTEAPVYVVHLSCADALDMVSVARRRGVTAWVETLMPLLLLDKADAERAHFEGAKYVMSPPLRARSHRARLWSGLRAGEIHTVSSDHAPFDYVGQKTLGRADFRHIPNGLPGVENRVLLLYTYGVLTGGIDLNRFVELASVQAAKLFGIYPRKGAIGVGSDADLVVFDPNYAGVIAAARHAMNVDYNPFEGCKTQGRAEVVTVRGEVVVDHGRFVGSPGRGRCTCA